MPAASSIDEARLEGQCIRLLQAVDQQSHSVTRPDDGIHCLSSAVVTSLGWMYMDLERAVLELESILSHQQDDGRIPPRPGAAGVVLPLLASIFRMIYHSAKQRQRNLESRLAALVLPIDRLHLFLFESARGEEHRLARNLNAFAPEDSRVISARGGEPPLECGPSAQDVHNEAPRPPSVVEVGLNALLVQAESDLADVAIHIGFPTQQIIYRRTHRARAVAERLWRQELRCFSSKTDDGEWCPLAGEDLLPLWSGAALRHQARSLLHQHLRPGHGFWTDWPLATLPADGPGFVEDALGSGAVDPLLNWLMVRGLHRYGETQSARAISDASLGLAARHGLCQAFSCRSGTPVGLTSWAPTAAVVLDLLKTPSDFERW